MDLLDRLVNAIELSQILLDSALESDSYRTLLFLVFGAGVGSFLSVVIYRLPKINDERTLLEAAEAFPLLIPGPKLRSQLTGISMAGFSYAPCCDHKINWYHNIPILSWLILRGKCAYCGKPISAQYVTLELMLAIIFALIAWFIPDAFKLLLVSLSLATFVTISIIDLKHMMIPNELNLFLFVIGVVGIDTGVLSVDISLTDAIVSAAIVFLLIEALNYALLRFKGTIGIGGGDIKLLAVIAMPTGVQMVLWILLAAIMISMGWNRFKGVATGQVPLAPAILVCAIPPLGLLI
ncbi:prepilin peptidase [Vibrio sp.]|uniref:prepilin peptidase n=1 Tax=Vibrio sp. TaxID=678 RepID=UPI003D0CC04F